MEDWQCRGLGLQQELPSALQLHVQDLTSILMTPTAKTATYTALESSESMYNRGSSMIFANNVHCGLIEDSQCGALGSQHEVPSTLQLHVQVLTSLPTARTVMNATYTALEPSQSMHTRGSSMIFAHYFQCGPMEDWQCGALGCSRKCRPPSSYMCRT
jgi:hypothetical protein